MRIVYIDIDSLRPDHLGCYGYNRPTSPHIDKIAAQGTRCNHYYCCSSPCLPSRTALVSGRFGYRNGVTSNFGAGAQFHLRCGAYGGPRPDNMLLPRRLRELGLHTASVSNFADRHAAYYFMAGFAEFITPNLKRGAETAQEVNEAALRWLAQNADREHFFLHVNYWDAHRTYQMDPKWTDLLNNTPVTIPWPDDAAAAEMHARLTGPFTGSGQFKSGQSTTPLMPNQVANRRDFEHMITGYDTAIAYVDHHVGQIIDLLEAQGQMEQTAIIISADHGDAFGEHGIYGDHVCADECIHHVPLIVRWPGVTEPGSVDDALLYNVDLAPTLCALLGGEPAADWDGSSFHENLAGRPGLQRDYLVWDHGLYTLQRAVRTRTHLMIRTYDNYGYAGFDPVALYDMQADPYQTTNRASTQPELVGHCETLLHDWISAQVAKGHTHPDPLLCTLAERQAAKK